MCNLTGGHRAHRITLDFYFRIALFGLFTAHVTGNFIMLGLEMVHATKLAIAKLRQNRPLLLFPEGTRTTRQPVNQFRGGFALMAKLAGVPVQTVFIETNSRFLGKGWPLLKKPDLPLVYRVHLGRRFEVEGDVRQFVATLEQYFSGELR